MWAIVLGVIALGVYLMARRKVVPAVVPEAFVPPMMDVPPMDPMFGDVPSIRSPKDAVAIVDVPEDLAPVPIIQPTLPVPDPFKFTLVRSEFWRAGTIWYEVTMTNVTDIAQTFTMERLGETLTWTLGPGKSHMFSWVQSRDRPGEPIYIDGVLRWPT